MWASTLIHQVTTRTPACVRYASTCAHIYDHPALQYGTPSHPALQYGTPSHPALQYGTPSHPPDILLKPGFVIGYDREKRNPSWVAEKLQVDTVRGGKATRKGVRFHEERNIDPQFRARLSDYRRSGYDRGHLAAAGNHKSSHEHMRATFTLANAIPQVGPGFNQGYWARIEQWARELAIRHTTAFVITGPLYVGGGPVDRIGSSPGVAIPTHLFKSILLFTGGNEQTTCHTTLLLPNQKIHPKTPLSTFVTPHHEIEDEAGIELFPLISSTHVECLLNKPT